MFDHCFHWMSYMCKENSKGDAPWHHREFGGSQVPRRWTATGWPGGRPVCGTPGGVVVWDGL